MPDVNIDREIYNKLKKRAEVENYETVESYTNSILEALVEEYEDLDLTDGGEQTQTEEEKVKSRLRQLGYLE